jgi:RNA polymerase sigma-70 factor (ECF subfamily)
VLLVSVRRQALETRARERLGMLTTPPAVSPQEAWLEGLDDELVPEAVRLRVIDELEYDEVAAVLGTTTGAARVRVHRGLAALRKERNR